MIIVERPIRRIGAFYDKLPKAEQAVAKELARQAHKLPRMAIQKVYYRLKSISENANYA